MKEMSSRPAPWSDKRHIRVADKPVSQPEVLVQPGPGQAALKLGGLLFGECLLTDESTVKSWGDNRAQGQAFFQEVSGPLSAQFHCSWLSRQEVKSCGAGEQGDW